ncbi:hypothetical protein DPMN_070382 [Dreissena polymorpha]|uniref:Uncharacterized protein n=1 Tax=Dreissena polymorpha TaxID=45954 RepID=A0A9D3Z579_DREPO|nr:hypothetical protein DPMN_070382 [Dreissena polymorpha]
MLRTKASEVEDGEQEERMSRFIKCYDDEYHERMVFMAKKSMAIERFNNQKLLPIVENVVRLSTCLRNEASILRSSAPTDLNTPADLKEIYSSLCKVSLAEVILFNRKRSGEAERLKTEDFVKGSVNDVVDEDISHTLSKFERHLCKSHFRIETRGKSLKRGRRVSILLTKEMKENLNTLLRLQSKLQIESKYVFMRPSGRKPYRGNDVLKEATEKAKVTHASRITSTSLRKQLETLSQFLNLTESSQDILATFMGHDIRTHREYYRLPEGTLEVAKVSKILHQLNMGKITQTDAAQLHGNQTIIGNYSIYI